MKQRRSYSQYIHPSLHLALTLLLVAGLGLMGCSSLSNTEKGAAAGAGGGAVVGGIIGKIAGNTAAGALIGAAVGGTAGAVIGQQMDKQAAELEEELAGAEVNRVGEGIHIAFDNAILFPFDSSELLQPARENLATLAQSLEAYPNTEVLVIGHTDAQGSDAYNQGLSERRAQAAATYLMEQGVMPSRVTSIGKGEGEPVASNETAEGRAQNRRVEVAIFASEEYRAELEQQN